MRHGLVLGPGDRVRWLSPDGTTRLVGVILEMDPLGRFSIEAEGGAVHTLYPEYPTLELVSLRGTF